MSSRDLLNTVNWQNKDSRSDDRSFVKKPKKAIDAITAAEEDAGALEVRVKPGESAKQTRAKQKTQQFIELVKNGLTPEDAAARIGLDLGEVQRIGSGTDMKSLVADVIEKGHIRTDIRKTMLQSALNINIMEAHLDGDRKNFATLWKLAASEPEIGLTGPSTVNAIQVNFTDLASVIGEFMEEEKVSGPPQISLDTIPELTVSSNSDGGEVTETSQTSENESN